MIRVLAVAALAFAVASPVFAPPVTTADGGSALPCRLPAGITLTLQLTAGFHYPGVVSLNQIFRPAPDIPPGMEPLPVPLYPGAVPSKAAFIAPDFAAPVDIRPPRRTYIKSAWAEEELPVPDDVANPWYMAELGACGYSPLGGASDGRLASGAPIPPTMTFVCDFPQTLPLLEISFQRVASGRWIVLYVGFDGRRTPGAGTCPGPAKRAAQAAGS